MSETQLGQAIFDARRNLRIHSPIDHPGSFQVTQPLGELLLRDRFDSPLELAEANRPARLVQCEEDVNRPLVCDQLDRPACRTIQPVQSGLFVRKSFVLQWIANLPCRIDPTPLVSFWYLPY